ncbi:agmatinase [Andreesenia angusta]|uniref:Agmatinase n=2 Tax=Andreesenia angusta TaxID=39480 RepID=A0A1S1V772_9FIRM|nr:agmatinase [Andreesenia angusta]
MFNTYKTDRFIGFESDYENSDVVLLGAPFDGTVSYRPGTRFAPMAVRTESYGLETYSPYLDLDLEDYKLSDIGDVEFPFGNKEATLSAIKSEISKVVADGKKPLMVGGEHLVTLPAVEALYEKYPDLHIIHFDAHTDLREDYMGEVLSHATVLRRAWDVVGDGRIYQFGIRSGMKEEFEWAKSHTYLEKFSTSTLASKLEELKDVPVYLTIDLDVLDPSVFPGTGTPEPGGIDMKEMLAALVSMKGINFVGADVVELSPHYDASGASTAVACKVVREVTLLLAE